MLNIPRVVNNIMYNGMFKFFSKRVDRTSLNVPNC